MQVLSLTGSSLPCCRGMIGHMLKGARLPRAASSWPGSGSPPHSTCATTIHSSVSVCRMSCTASGSCKSLLPADSSRSCLPDDARLLSQQTTCSLACHVVSSRLRALQQADIVHAVLSCAWVQVAPAFLCAWLLQERQPPECPATAAARQLRALASPCSRMQLLTGLRPAPPGCTAPACRCKTLIELAREATMPDQWLATVTGPEFASACH